MTVLSKAQLDDELQAGSSRQGEESLSEIIAEIRDFPSLLDAFRKRKAELGTTDDAIDDLCLFAKGHTSKMLKRVPSKHMTAITMMTLMMGLGCKMLLVEDTEQFAKIRNRLARSKWTQNRRNATAGLRPGNKRKSKAARINPFKGNSEWGRQMDMRAKTVMTPAFIKRQRTAAAKARWTKVRRK